MLMYICPSSGDLPTQGLNPGLLHCRQILYHLSHQGSPFKIQSHLLFCPPIKLIPQKFCWVFVVVVVVVVVVLSSHCVLSLGYIANGFKELVTLTSDMHPSTQQIILRHYHDKFPI